MTFSVDLQFAEWALDALERREVRVLVWGLVDSALSDEEVTDILNSVLDKHASDLTSASCTISTAEDLRDRLVELAQLFEVPGRAGSPRRWRTRMAEGLRLLARLRQMFPNKHSGRDRWISAPTLVADFRFLWRPRRYPMRNLSTAQAIDQISLATSSTGVLEAVRHWFAKARLDWTLAQFQIDASARILAALNAGVPRGTIVAAGTGSGKTLAFYLPALSWLAAQKKAYPESMGVRILALYPRNELLKDQLSEVYAQSRKFDDLLGRTGSKPISVGVLYGDTPFTLNAALGQWDGSNGSAACPFFRCPKDDCGGEMRLHSADIKAKIERLRCIRCGTTVDGQQLRLSRASMQRDPPDVLFTSVEMLNQRMADSQTRHLFGVGPGAQRVPALVLLDEVHLYTGTYGAQVGYLLRRWSAITGRRSSFVGLSATIAEGKSFFASLVGMDGAVVEEISPAIGDMQDEGAEYLVALRGDPVSQTALLSTSIQSLMLSSRLLDPQDRVGPKRPFSGWRAFAFTDQMDATNRLYYDLLDAEGRNKRGLPATGRHPNGGLAVLREPMSSLRRYEGGQDWRTPKAIGHELTRRHRVSRTTAYDTGVETQSEIVVATAALEVGYDDPAVGVVLQHKAPRDLAQFLQRKGRAGRTRHMRPWTLMVLSDYGRDRVAYQAYDQYFDPELPARELPMANRYVRRMQAVYALIDYIGMRMQAGEPSGSAWRDLQGPQSFPSVGAWGDGVQERLNRFAIENNYPVEASTWRSIKGRAFNMSPAYPAKERWQGVNAIAHKIRRRFLVSLLSGTLTNASTAESLARHLSAALDLTLSDVDALLWDHPRPILLTVVPTALRRLATDWRANEQPHADHVGNAPFPEFVPATLFSDLSLPELRLEPPGYIAGEDTRYLPVQQALSELAPGKVSRRLDNPFWLGVDATELQLILDADAPDVEAQVDATRWYRLERQPSCWMLENGRPTELEAYRPVAAMLTVPPDGRGPVPNILDTSNARLDWRSQIFARQGPLIFESPSGRVGIAKLVGEVHVHVHAGQSPAVVRRYAIGSNANLRVRVGRETMEQAVNWRFRHDDKPCGIGFEMEVDALRFVLKLPRVPHAEIDWADVVRVRAARSARYVWEAQYGSELSLVERNSFLRVRLAEIFQMAVTLLASAGNGGLKTAIASVGQGRETATLQSVLSTIFQSQLPEDGDEDDADIIDGENSGRLRLKLEAALQNPLVLSGLEQMAAVLVDPIDESWDAWLKSTMKHTLGAAIIDAIQQSCPQIDPDELAVDVEPGPREDGSIAGDDELWITEVNPGGNGLIEQVVELLAQEPDRFYRHLEAALQASEFELIDSQLQDTVNRLGRPEPDAELLECAQLVRGASTSGDAERSLAGLRRVLVERGHAIFHGFVVALSNRLLRPGTPPALDTLLVEFFERWFLLESALGIEVDARVMCALYSNDVRIDDIFAEAGMQLPNGAREAWRFSALMGVVWARGHSLRAGALPLQSRFTNIAPITDRLLLEPWLTKREQAIDALVPDWAIRFRELLGRTGRASISIPSGNLAICGVVQKVVTEPVQLDYLNVYPRLTTVRRQQGAIEFEFELTESI